MDINLTEQEYAEKTGNLVVTHDKIIEYIFSLPVGRQAKTKTTNSIPT